MKTTLRRFVQSVALLAPIALIACSAGQDTSEDALEAQLAQSSEGELQIGFNGPPETFPFVPKFMKASAGSGQKKVFCHTYIDWTVADEADAANGGDPTADGTRAYLHDFLNKAQGTCDEVLLSFKAPAATNNVPTVDDFTNHMEAFFKLGLAKDAGYKGDLVFTAWNEPNNGASDGDGLGVKIPAETAARFYLSLANLCTKNDCKVVAGDFASNGDMWNDMERNCSDDLVDAKSLCTKNSAQNADGSKPASYMDRYVNTIANEATQYGQNKDFHPYAFAFHGWHDVNNYVDSNDACTSYDDCLVRRMMFGFESTWTSMPLWDTETGIGQKEQLTDAAQACGAAFLIRTSTLTKRITRMYVTRLAGGQVRLFDDLNTARPAMSILAQRETTAEGFTCGANPTQQLNKTDCGDKADGWWCLDQVGYMAYCKDKQIAGGCGCAACTTGGVAATCSAAAPPAACPAE